MALSDEAKNLKSDLMAIAEGYVGCDENIQKSLMYDFLQCMSNYSDIAIFLLTEDDDE